MRNILLLAAFIIGSLGVPLFADKEIPDGDKFTPVGPQNPQLPQSPAAVEIYYVVQNGVVTIVSDVDIFGDLLVIGVATSVDIQGVCLTGYTFPIQDADRGKTTIYITVDGTSYWATI